MSRDASSTSSQSKQNLLLWGIGAGVVVGGIAGFLYFRNQRYANILDEVRGSLNVSTEQLQRVKAAFRAEMVEGLRAPENNSALKMIPTFVTQVPTGTEKVS